MINYVEIKQLPKDLRDREQIRTDVMAIQDPGMMGSVAKQRLVDDVIQVAVQQAHEEIDPSVQQCFSYASFNRLNRELTLYPINKPSTTIAPPPFPPIVVDIDIDTWLVEKMSYDILSHTLTLTMLDGTTHYNVQLPLADSTQIGLMTPSQVAQIEANRLAIIAEETARIAADNALQLQITDNKDRIDTLEDITENELAASIKKEPTPADDGTFEIKLYNKAGNQLLDTIPITMATISYAGLMPKEAVKQVAKNTEDIAHLQSIGSIISIDKDLTADTDPDDLSTWWLERSGRPQTNQDTLKSLTNGASFAWFADETPPAWALLN